MWRINLIWEWDKKVVWSFACMNSFSHSWKQLFQEQTHDIIVAALFGVKSGCLSDWRSTKRGRQFVRIFLLLKWFLLTQLHSRKSAQACSARSSVLRITWYRCPSICAGLEWKSCFCFELREGTVCKSWGRGLQILTRYVSKIGAVYVFWVLFNKFKS